MNKPELAPGRRTFLQLTGLGLVSTRFLSGCLKPTSTDAPNEVEITEEGAYRVVRGNGVPDHPTGEFPNRHCPNPIREQTKAWRMPLAPVAAAALTPIGFTVFGVALNGVPFDPAGPHFEGDDSNAWQFDPSAPQIGPYLGIDLEVGHTQPNGAYHYHGVAPDLVAARAQADRMTLLGWAADGFPIYWQRAPRDAAQLASPLVDLRPSYRLRAGARPADAPIGAFDGAFLEDYEYVEGLGDLDAANGRTGPTPEFPGGTYYYVLTDAWPFIPRHHRGTPDASFKHPGTPGKAGVPSELRDYGH